MIEWHRGQELNPLLLGWSQPCYRNTSPIGKIWSRWLDLNQRPPAPKAGALTKLSYTQNGTCGRYRQSGRLGRRKSWVGRFMARTVFDSGEYDKQETGDRCWIRTNIAGIKIRRTNHCPKRPGTVCQCCWILAATFGYSLDAFSTSGSSGVSYNGQLSQSPLRMSKP